MKGPRVDDWTEEQQKRMDTNVGRGRPRTSELHWTEFELAFKATYANIAEKISAEKDIRNLRMTGGDIDTYIATFKTLLSQAGYTETERGALEMFKKGLPFGLNLRIINNVSPTPDTFENWAEAAKNQQLKWLEGQEFTSKKGLSPKQQALAHKLKLGGPRRDPNAMDVDGGKFNPLTPEEREELRKIGACFRCRKQGHMSKQCPGNAEYGRPAPAQSAKRASPTTKTPSVEELLEQTKDLLTNQEYKQKYFDALVESGFV
jgi:hypothetical protein